MSGNNEEIDNYAAQDLEIMNTKEATAYFWTRGAKRGAISNNHKIFASSSNCS